MAHDFDNAYIQSWNVNIQREVARDLGISIGYFGNKGTHLRLSRNINQRVNGVLPFPSLRSNDPFRQNVPLVNIIQIEGTGNSSYNALWLTATKRLSRGFQFNTSYTFSKSIDYNSLNSQGVVIQDNFNVRGSRGLSDYDARHRFVFSGIYELPFHGNQLVEGWQLGTIVQSQSGNPVNIVVNNAALTGVNNTVRPNVTGPIDILGTPNRWFDIAPFVVPPNQFGNLGRNVVIGPGFNNTDFSVIKRTKLTETPVDRVSLGSIRYIQPCELWSTGTCGRNCKLRADHEYALCDGRLRIVAADAVCFEVQILRPQMTRICVNRFTQIRVYPLDSFLTIREIKLRLFVSHDLKMNSCELVNRLATFVEGVRLLAFFRAGDLIGSLNSLPTDFETARPARRSGHCTG